ncbi:MAG: hypothetical protein GKS06_08505 [Acidobacteria bacterium]|nr:hypothetical protein [Acidobacteriota bacterium]
MRRMIKVFALAAAIAIALPVTAEEVRTFSANFDGSALDELYVDFPIGELRVEGTRSERIMVEVTIECSSRRSLDACIDRAEAIELESRERSDRLDLWVEGFSKWRSRGMHLEMKVLVPENLDVRIDMSIGELELEQLYGNVAVDMSIGEVSLRSAEEMISRVSIDTGIGEASLSTHRGRNSSAGLFTREVLWTEGNGDSEVRIELGIGEISVRLR